LTVRPTVRFLILLFCLTGIAATAAASAEPVIVVDEWWTSDYAASGCFAADGCLNPKERAADFEDALAAQMAATPTCRTTTIFRFKSPGAAMSRAAQDAMAKSHFTLIVDFTVGVVEQRWTLQEENNSMSGQGTPNEIATQVCNIVTGAGAKIIR
jgi:hypothetical protein